MAISSFPVIPPSPSKAASLLSPVESQLRGECTWGRAGTRAVRSGEGTLDAMGSSPGVSGSSARSQTPRLGDSETVCGKKSLAVSNAIVGTWPPGRLRRWLQVGAASRRSWSQPPGVPPLAHTPAEPPALGETPDDVLAILPFLCTRGSPTQCDLACRR